MLLLLYIAVASTLCCLLLLGVVFAANAPARRIRSRLTKVVGPGATTPTRPRRTPQSLLFGAARKLRSYAGISETPKLRERFERAGIRSPNAADYYLAARLLGPMAGVLLATFAPGNTFFWALCLGGVAYMAPEFWLDRRIVKRRNAIGRSLPYALDLLVICVDAGLGLDQAMLRVGQELAVSHPQINEEFLRISREQRTGLPRLDAWKQMAARTKLNEIHNFVNMLVQTDRFGTPIARALSTFADDIRLKRRQQVEEKAAKTTVKLLFPLVICIFPCIFIVLLGPAIISVSKGLFSALQ